MSETPGSSSSEPRGHLDVELFVCGPAPKTPILFTVSESQCSAQCRGVNLNRDLSGTEVPQPFQKAIWRHTSDLTDAGLPVKEEVRTPKAVPSNGRDRHSQCSDLHDSS